jgi:hypothetical protein
LADGGRLVAIVVGEHGLGRGTVVYMIAGSISRRVAFDGSVHILQAFTPAPQFHF